ncbi:potassium/sodium hyperpolarization-activated cyclic nucleotide-gated channel 2-like [Ursus maritimus]|uniref:Potassium/sodium hyperpolarization-activated cyclic nucleotide-gated channel 2-like n=1 Tax=Ursus maritimus TaxID=29073 RepID=A0A8M1FF05_URSMA|nr:potassium/sodium hyperpolarization-activated cyclic nucleotide-gated channel 2-like [Ursus maritimus]
MAADISKPSIPGLDLGALPARSCAAPGGQNGGVEQSSEARGAGGPARPGAARGTDIAPSRPVASPRPGPGALTISRFPPPGRRRRNFVAGSGPARPRLRKPGPARPGTRGVCLRRVRGCRGRSSTRRQAETRSRRGQRSAGKPIVWGLRKQGSDMCLLPPRTFDVLLPGPPMDTPDRTETPKSPLSLRDNDEMTFIRRGIICI